MQNWIADNEAALKAQSRSFAIPILNLEPAYRLPVMVQYNINKLLDTIEDAPMLAPVKRAELIQTLCVALQQHKTAEPLQEFMLECLPAAEKPVFEHYASIIALFNHLSAEEQALGLAWSLQMADGMCEYLLKPVITTDDLNQYCYYVAGTVGCYLTDLLHLHGQGLTNLCSQQLRCDAVSFGLFLQKLNVIRDYVEDYEQKDRQFWPQQYFIDGLEPVAILNRLCFETLSNDVPAAIYYARTIPAGNESFENFIRFILLSGLDYLKLLINNKKVFDPDKIKLPKTIIKTLYQRVAKLSRQQFYDLCQQHYNALQQQIAATKNYA